MRKVSVITGGAGGMGLATAKLMGQDHQVVICDVSQERLDAAQAELRGLGIACEAVVCDITNRESVAELVRRAQQLGTVASLIHTAGVSPQMGKPELIMRINALGTIHVSDACYAIAQEGFCLVNVASMAAYTLPNLFVPTRAYKLAGTDQEAFLRKALFVGNFLPQKLRSGIAYSISKNFVVWYSKQQAARFGQKGGRVLSVSPGSIDTAMGRLEIKSGSEKMLQFAALKRFGRPEEVAEVLAFCASDKASYLTGIDILCDGGVIAGVTPKDLRSLSVD
ncbi:SDR family oxidoreductase [Hymenobacter monticola]|uniref:SDR family oxidoreductase n=1 Tax=Hymenobacter monticola TaxID=1705399 RepID=A0ABY4BC99_9BACT|nr:SDR family oxidoreductase [Hymenobacter monticola]UOE36404.1 SDR family oxidoreductase [Hymenobacter monticola]